MAQELIDKIRAAAQAKGIDPETALRIARAESSNDPAAKAKTSTAGGLFQVVDKTWKEFGGKPGKKFDADENIRVGTDIISSNTNYLKKVLNRDPRPAEIYAAHYFGPSGAKSFLTADPETPIVDILGKEAVKANPNLQGKTAGQVLAQLETKMGSKPAPANVSRETPAPAAREALPPSLPPMAAAPMKEQVASLGPGYQAALALSFLADSDDKPERDVEKEPGIAEQWLAQQPTTPSVMSQFADVSIKSPFAAPGQTQMFAHGGQVQRFADGGPALVPRVRMGSATRNKLEGIRGQYDAYNRDAEAYNAAASSYEGQEAAYNRAVEEYNAGAREADFTGTEPVFTAQAPVAPGTTPEQFEAMQQDAQRGLRNRSLSLQVAQNPQQFGFQMERMFADGGEVTDEPMPDVGRPTVQETYLARAMFPELPIAEAVYLLRGGSRQSTPQGEMLSGNIGARVPLGKDADAMFMLTGSRPERDMSESKALMAAFNKRVGDEGGLNLNVVRPLDAPGGVYAGGLSGSYPMGEGRIMGNVNALKLPGQDPRITGYGVGYGGRVGPGNLSAMLMKQKDGPYSGQIEYRLPIGRADGGEVTAEELAAASKPAFLTPKSGIGRRISTKPGELEGAALQGVSEMPYLLAGAPVDLATMAMRPFGYDVEKPMFGSEDLKQRALAAGIRQKPPEGKAARALYELTQAGASAVNPAAPVRGAVAAAEKTGEAAKMLARDFQQYNRQLDVPGASYAVKPKGGTFAYTPGDADRVNPITKIGKMVQNYGTAARDVDAPDELLEFLKTKAPKYFTTSYGTASDPLRTALREQRIQPFGLDAVDISPELIKRAARTQDPDNLQARIDLEKAYDNRTGISANVLKPEDSTWEFQRNIRKDISEKIGQEGVTAEFRNPASLNAFSQSEFAEYPISTEMLRKFVENQDKLPPNLQRALQTSEPMYDAYPLSALLQPSNVVEALQQVPANKLKNMSFPEALIQGTQALAPVRDYLAAINLAEKGAKVPRKALDMFTTPVMEAPSFGGQWVTLDKSVAAKMEGKLMNHSVGDYNAGTTYGRAYTGLPHGGKKAFDEGLVRVYSLRDAEGLPKVTLEMAKSDAGKGNTWNVTQIRGRFNSEPLPETRNDIFSLFDKIDSQDGLNTIKQGSYSRLPTGDSGPGSVVDWAKEYDLYKQSAE